MELSSLFSTNGMSAAGSSSIPSKTYCRVLLATSYSPLNIQPDLTIPARVMDGRSRLRQLGPVGYKGVVGRGIFCILPLVGADVVAAVVKVFYRLRPHGVFLYQDGGGV